MNNKNYLIILYRHSDGGEGYSQLTVISELSKEATITRATDIRYTEGNLDMMVYINGVFAESDTQGSADLIIGGKEWNQEIRDEAYEMLMLIKKRVQDRKDGEERVRKQKEEERKQEAAKSLALQTQQKEEKQLKELLKKHSGLAKRLLDSQDAADE